MLGLGRLLNKYRMWRYGGATGLNYVSASATMTTVVAIPWLFGYIFCFIFIPDPFLEGSIVVMSGLWIGYCYGVYAYAKVDATKYRPLPQALFRFPDGGQAKYDIMIPQDGFVEECDFDDGTKGYRINFGKRLQYWDRRSEFPFVFDYGLFKLPAKKPDECFEFMSEGEYFHKQIAIKTPACENVSFYVHGWIQDKDGRYVPVGQVYDCSLAYKRALNKDEKKTPKELRESQFFGMAFMHERNRRILLERHSTTLENIVDAKEVDSRDFEGRVEKGMDTRRGLYKHILDTEKSLVQRIKANLFKIFLAVLLLIGFLWLIGVIRF